MAMSAARASICTAPAMTGLARKHADESNRLQAAINILAVLVGALADLSQRCSAT
jgi:hypothetical protein